jgi:hypothetical protein
LFVCHCLCVEFYKKAFGAKEKYRMYRPDGKTIGHTEIKIGDSMIMLAESLERRPLEPRIKIPPPMIQRANALLRLRFDIPKFDSFIGLGSADLCCITGYHSNLILTRLCVRSLLPERYGGLNSPYILIADAGNRTDVYRAINFARQYGMNKEQVGDRILVIRAFTVSQVLKLLSVELPN